MNLSGLMHRAGGLVALLVLAVSALSGCGGDSSDPSAAPRQTEVTVGVAGVTSAIGALTYTVTLPAGFTLPADSQGDLLPEVIVLDANLPAGQVTSASNYIAPTAVLPGALTVAVLFTQGFFTDADGEPIFRIIRSLASGEVSPAMADLPLVLIVEDLNGAAYVAGFSSTLSVATVPVP